MGCCNLPLRFPTTSQDKAAGGPPFYLYCQVLGIHLGGSLRKMRSTRKSVATDIFVIVSQRWAWPRVSDSRRWLAASPSLPLFRCHIPVSPFRTTAQPQRPPCSSRTGHARSTPAPFTARFLFLEHSSSGSLLLWLSSQRICHLLGGLLWPSIRHDLFPSPTPTMSYFRCYSPLFTRQHSPLLHAPFYVFVCLHVSCLGTGAPWK